MDLSMLSQYFFPASPTAYFTPWMHCTACALTSEKASPTTGAGATSTTATLPWPFDGFVPPRAFGLGA